MYNGTCCIAGIFFCETYNYVKSIFFMEQFRTSVGGFTVVLSECGCTALQQPDLDLTSIFLAQFFSV